MIVTADIVQKQSSLTMGTFFNSTLLLLTIVAAFAFGVASGYWVIRGFLNFFNPSRTEANLASKTALAPTSSGD